jgi:hypothetical protein
LGTEHETAGPSSHVGDDAVEEELVVAAVLLLDVAAGKANCETGQRMVSFLRMCSSAMPFAVAIVRALPSPVLSFFTTLPFNPAEYALPIGLNLNTARNPTSLN